MNQGRWASLIAFTVLAFSLSAASAQGGQPFSADTTTTLTKGETVTGKVYFSPPKVRMDSNTRGHQSIMIIDASTKTSYMLMPQQKMYMEMHADPGGFQPGQAPSTFDPKHPCAADATCKMVGTETINGRVCQKWETTTKHGTMTTWIDQKLYYAMKVVSAGYTSELSNVKEGKQDPSLFEVPAGYHKMGTPGGLPR
jgi:hypothetical protein